MPGLPMPSIVGNRRAKTYRIYQVVKSKPGRYLIFMLIAVLALYTWHINFSGTLRYGNAPSWIELAALDSLESGDEEPLATPLTSQGLVADKAFHLGSTSKERYKTELEQFATRAFPKWLRKRAHKSIELYLGDSTDVMALPQIPHKIYQTAKREPYWTDQRFRSWQNIPGYSYHFFDDPRADKWVRGTFSGTEVEQVWNKLGAGIKRSDLLRYLLVLADGGIYSDLDTVRLKPISKWGGGADFNGPEIINPPSVFVGIEADVANRRDWRKWWPRPLQIAQWTFAAAPMHPILIDTIRRVHHITAKVEVAKTQSSNSSETQLVGGERQDGEGDVSIMEWTGRSTPTSCSQR
ncbi:membrane-bound alpha-1,6- mannosyltransferase Initiation-specific [Ceratobasidium sp. UAMH 11750]|nr:membrane-bound alpha-1,6- mannosyltransferase Initiation-specific [Ceratobasidium sp. UAMH 11750]